MRIVVAPDKFKNSLTGMEFCNIVEEGIQKIHLDIEVIKLPLADGGDGTIEVVNFYLNGEIVNLTVNNPFFQPIKASYLFSKSLKTAFIEMAEASGLKLLKQNEPDCKNATTLGTGELIIDAIDKGATKIILGIGGSATNDCGIGMATALGYQFLDSNNREVKPIGANLSKITSINDLNVHPNLKEIEFEIACDVTNPLYGIDGAAYVYAAQKGASQNDIEMLNIGLKDFSKILNKTFNIDAQSVSGAGAAGGMGIASKVFLHGKLLPGIELIKNLARFDEKIEGADWIITGEGKLDIQTLSGKTIQGVIHSAKSQKIKVATFCGSNELDEKDIKGLGISYSDSIMNKARNLDDALKNANTYLRDISIKFSVEQLNQNIPPLYPLKFNPVYSYRIWGGDKLKTVLNKNYTQESIGESWEISDVKGNETYVSEGALKGSSLKDLIKTYKGNFVGDHVYKTYGIDFPLLIKFIDAKTPLSIQVHPSDQLAQERHNSFGKNEMWYVMQAEKDAELILGFNQEVEKENYKHHLKNNSLKDLLNIEKVTEGDTFYIPTGRVHAIGGGVLLAEIQQTSNITYRIYDYDRVDKKTGKKRELHTELALGAIDFNHYENYKTSYKKDRNTLNTLVNSPYFKTNFIHVEKEILRELTTIDSFVIYICLNGSLTMNYNNQNFTLKQGETILIPASIDHLSFQSENAKILEVFL